MKFLIDAHTHAIGSHHAYSTIDENVRQAASVGLQMMALTDHAPGMHHTTGHAYFANLHVIPNVLHGVRLLKGIELNIMDYNGTIDMDDALLSKLDIAIAGLHKPCILSGTMLENTKAVIGAMEQQWVDVLGHPGDPFYPIELKAVYRAAKETGCLLEVNDAALSPEGFRAGSAENMEVLLKLCMEDGTPVIVGSDAHFYTSVGAFSNVERLLQKIGFPEELVLNTEPEKLLKNLKRNRKK